MKVFSALLARSVTFGHTIVCGPSKTVPDQVEPLSSMLARYAHGVPLVGNAAEPMFYGEDTPPDLSSMDLNDIMEYRQDLDFRIRSMRDELSRVSQSVSVSPASDPPSPVSVVPDSPSGDS